METEKRTVITYYVELDVSDMRTLLDIFDNYERSLAMLPDGIESFPTHKSMINSLRHLTGDPFFNA